MSRRLNELHAADFDDAVLLLDFEPGGFRIENDLAHLQLYRPGQQAVDGDVGELIDVFIAFMSRMSLDPMPFDILRRRGRIQQLPQILILDRLARRRAPAARLPIAAAIR